MGYAVAALSFGITFKKFAYLEEKHDKYRFRKLCFSTRKETNSQRTNRGYRHQEVLIEGIAMSYALDSLVQRLVSNQQIGHQIDEQQLPSGQLAMLLYQDSTHQQQCRGRNEQQLPLQTIMIVMMMVMFMFAMFMLVFVNVLMFSVLM